MEKSVTCCRRTSSLDHCLSGEQTSFSLATETLGLIYYDSSCVLKTNEVKGGNVEAPWVHTGWQCHLHTDGCYSLWDPGTLKGCLQCCQLWLSGSSVHHLVLPTALCICSRISILMLEVIGFRSRQLLEPGEAFTQSRELVVFRLILRSFLTSLKPPPYSLGVISRWTSTSLH